MSLPNIAVKHSIKINVEEGKSYAWCSCGLSESQPFCDGSHAGTEFRPVIYQASEGKMVGFCGCKHSKKGALCDGSHRDL